MASRDEFLVQATRRYLDFLRSVVRGESFFPLELRVGKTTLPRDYAPYQEQLRNLRSLAGSLGLRLDWVKVRSSRFGEHERPERAWFDKEEDYLKAIGKGNEVGGFRKDIALIREMCPPLSEWISENVRKILDQQGRWEKLLRVVCWLGAYPRSNLYTRQLPIIGVDSKFIEQNKTILDELVLVAYPQHVDISVVPFELRHGLRQAEPLIRLRFLDLDLQVALGFPIGDFSIPVTDFRNLALESIHVIVTENLRNFLALSCLPRAVVIYGGGNAVTLLKGTLWLTRVPIFYWGDIDVDGFLMLSRVRAFFPQTSSILMDSETLKACQDWVGSGNSADIECPLNLTSSEAALFQMVKEGNLRLEQERIPFQIALSALQEGIKRPEV